MKTTISVWHFWGSLKPILLLMALLLMGAAPTSAESKHAAEESGIKSNNSDMPALLTFANKSGQTIKLYWLDYGGRRVLYQTIKSDERVSQQTFLTHPWLVTDDNDNAWYLYYPDAQPRTIGVVAPSPP